jgi:hypothetical protein
MSQTVKAMTTITTGVKSAVEYTAAFAVARSTPVVISRVTLVQARPSVDRTPRNAARASRNSAIAS